jgi:hypothetical protein
MVVQFKRLSRVLVSLLVLTAINVSYLIGDNAFAAISREVLLGVPTWTDEDGNTDTT